MYYSLSSGDPSTEYSSITCNNQVSSGSIAEVKGYESVGLKGKDGDNVLGTTFTAQRRIKGGINQEDCVFVCSGVKRTLRMGGF